MPRTSKDPFKDLTKSAANLGLTEPKSKYQKYSSGRPNRPLEMRLLYLIITTILLIHAIVGLAYSVYHFLFELSSRKDNYIIIGFTVSVVFHLYRIVAFLATIPIGIFPKLPLIIIGIILVLVCFIVDVAMIVVAIIDRAVSVDIEKYIDIHLSMQKYASYAALDLIYIVLASLLMLAMFRYSRAYNSYKRSLYTSGGIDI